MLSSTVHRRLLIQIVTEAGDVVQIPGGGDLERDLVAVLERVIISTPVNWSSKLIGWTPWRSRAKVEIDLAIQDALRDALGTAITDTIAELKNDTRYVWTKLSE